MAGGKDCPSDDVVLGLHPRSSVALGPCLLCTGPVLGRRQPSHSCIVVVIVVRLGGNNLKESCLVTPGSHCCCRCCCAAQVKAQLPGKPQAINIMLAIEVEPHPQFSRRGYDIIYPLTLRLSEALTGK